MKLEKWARSSPSWRNGFYLLVTEWYVDGPLDVKLKGAEQNILNIQMILTIQNP